MATQSVLCMYMYQHVGLYYSLHQGGGEIRNTLQIVASIKKINGTAFESNHWKAQDKVIQTVTDFLRLRTTKLQAHSPIVMQIPAIYWGGGGGGGGVKDVHASPLDYLNHAKSYSDAPK